MNRAPAPHRISAISLISIISVVSAGCVGEESGFCEDTFDSTVTRVIDGDTLDVDLCGRVRLALVDAPERDEPGFVEARDFAASLCPVGGGATVDRDAGQPEDTTGTRLVAVVYCGGRNLNADLLAAGYAVILVEFCRISEFADDAWAAPHCDGA